MKSLINNSVHFTLDISKKGRTSRELRIKFFHEVKNILSKWTLNCHPENVLKNIEEIDFLQSIY